jgi:hypothetical protein
VILASIGIGGADLKTGTIGIQNLAIIQKWITKQRKKIGRMIQLGVKTVSTVIL